ncbi:MAG: hypothetical protein Q8M31_00495 [Beijerinckiaceae bacterium]|nr:hypothetical protein [Beijerinckiaceae bacterium]
MEYLGVEYRVVQGIKRGFWKWSVEIATGKKSGTSDSKAAAMAAAQRAIKNALEPDRGPLSRP